MGNAHTVPKDSNIFQIALGKRAEYTVHGYLHRIQKESKIANTPPLILFTCLKYVRDRDDFSTNTDYISMTNNNKTITKTNASGTKRRKKWHFAVGNTIIDTNKNLIAKWILTVNKCVKHGLGIVFGLHDAKGEWAFVSIYNSGVCHCFEDFETLKAQRVRKKSILFGEGDEIKVILDTKTERIKFKRGNGKDIVLFKRNFWSSKKVLKTKCRFAVGLYELDNSVAIKDFEIVYY